jgi:hypothetical protein
MSALHSIYDPIKEAERLAARGGGFVVFLGLGAAHHIRPCLRGTDTTGVMAICPGVRRLKALLVCSDLTDILADPRVTVAAPEDPDQVESMLLGRYLPTVDGDLRVVSLAGAVRTASSYFERSGQAVRRALDRTAADLSTQARLGKRWYANTLANLPRVRPTDLPEAASVVVAAAGPSLEDHRRVLREADFLISTDTAYPALRLMGHTPQMIVGIDCQQVSYLHYLGGVPPQVSVALDLAAPPVVARAAGHPIFMAGGHPLARYVSDSLRGLHPIDTSGGNVTHAAVSLAAAMGAARIQVVGADFGFPRAVPYARGTYFYPYFRSRESRANPLETALTAYVLDTDARRDRDGVYRTSRMEGYRKALLDAFPHHRVSPAAPGHLLMEADRPRRSEPPNQGPAGSHTEFLDTYRRAIRSLPNVTHPAGEYWRSLTSPQKRLWFTILPVAAGLAADHDTTRAMTEARHWCEQRLRPE